MSQSHLVSMRITYKNQNHVINRLIITGIKGSPYDYHHYLRLGLPHSDQIDYLSGEVSSTFNKGHDLVVHVNPSVTSTKSKAHVNQHSRKQTRPRRMPKFRTRRQIRAAMRKGKHAKKKRAKYNQKKVEILPTKKSPSSDTGTILMSLGYSIDTLGKALQTMSKHPMNNYYNPNY